jgi:hypothetical protein
MQKLSAVCLSVNFNRQKVDVDAALRFTSLYASRVHAARSLK